MPESRLNIAIAQLDFTVGDIAGNKAAILAAYEKAAAEGAQLVVFPEMAVTGYPAEDLILVPDFRAKAIAAAKEIAAASTKGAAIIFGTVWEKEGKVHNASLLCDKGKILSVCTKTMLPNYGVFDEKRVFDAGSGACVVEWNGVRLGMMVCEDVWHEAMATEFTSKADLVVVINGSPFEAEKIHIRHELLANAAKKSGAAFIYANLVGGQDDIVFDGGSFAVSAQGRIDVQMPQFESLIGYIDYNNGRLASLQHVALMSLEESLWEAMKLGLRDYVKKNGFTTVMLGLSGGIDSAISAALAVDALGPDNVKGVLMSSPYTSHESVEDAEATAKLLDIETFSVPITAGMEIFEEVLSPVFQESGWMKNPVIGGNLQARLRGVTLMALSNNYGWMLLSTGNKSEVAVGYSTLYGDSCGAYNVLKDLYKTQVYALANWRNSKGRLIPLRSITKAPTAELAPGQKDENQLPPYATLDQILALHIEGRQDAEEIIAQGFERSVVEKVLRLVRLNEYKRRQSCPGVKLSAMLFGRDRRFPLTNKY